MTLKDLTAGQSAIVDSVTQGSVGNRLLELGCLPGEAISVDRIAPFGDTMAVSFSDLKLCIRSNEANQIIVKPTV
jgi:ferrous iron transport protein A